MVPNSISIVVVTLILGMSSLGAFFWALRSNAFTYLEQHSIVLFEEHDLQVDRPWENSDQKKERKVEYGELVSPRPFEWGGAQ